jgi:small subunit ribosomal protein S6
VRPYEIVYVISPNLTDEERASKIERIQSLITEGGGEIEETVDWGKRIMAYEIRHFPEAYYGLTTFQLPPNAVKSIEERLNLDEEILRYQIVVREPEE